MNWRAALASVLGDWTRDAAIMRLRGGGAFARDVLRHPRGCFAVDYWPATDTGGEGPVLRLNLLPAGVRVADWWVPHWSGRGKPLTVTAARVALCVDALHALPVDWSAVAEGRVPLDRSLASQIEAVLREHGAAAVGFTCSSAEVH